VEWLWPKCEQHQFDTIRRNCSSDGSRVGRYSAIYSCQSLGFRGFPPLNSPTNAFSKIEGERQLVDIYVVYGGVTPKAYTGIAASAWHTLELTLPRGQPRFLSMVLVLDGARYRRPIRTLVFSRGVPAAHKQTSSLIGFL
jgi:hypothetical protein